MFLQKFRATGGNTKGRFYTEVIEEKVSEVLEDAKNLKINQKISLVNHQKILRFKWSGHERTNV